MTDLRSIDAVTGDAFGEPIPSHNLADVEAACAAAEAAFDAYRAICFEQRASFLERIGEEILNVGDDLIEVAMRESGLPRARLEGERGRTIGQLKLFADVVRRGVWAGVRIDRALPDRSPPRPDLRLRMIPLGPVAVFGASNFPLAFSTAGGDTAAALAAGCPVIVKGHPAHPATSMRVAGAIFAAAKATNMPAGVFAHLMGASHDLGAALVQNPRISAVGFTGSRTGGLALVKLAQARPVPIPVYAEMSSINPVLLMPAALSSRATEIANGFVGSLTLGAGQFCTNPGLILAIEGEGLDRFIAAASDAVSSCDSAVMLTSEICDAFKKGTAKLAVHDKVSTLALGKASEGANSGQAALFATEATTFLSDDELGQEIFGACALIVSCRDEAQMRTILVNIEGQLTATLQMDPDDEPLAARVLPLLERRAGRILVNSWPTGVEVTHAMVHGGPYPATSDARTSSVGSLAIERFLRPISYQNIPLSLLPPELRDDAQA